MFHYIITGMQNIAIIKKQKQQNNFGFMSYFSILVTYCVLLFFFFFFSYRHGDDGATACGVYSVGENRGLYLYPRSIMHLHTGSYDGCGATTLPT